MTTSKRKIFYAALALLLVAVVIFLCTPRSLDAGEMKIEYVLVDIVDENNALSSLDVTDKVDPDALALLLSEVSFGRIPRKFAPYQIHDGDIQILCRVFSGDSSTHYHLLLTSGDDPIYIVYNDAGSGGFNIRNGSELRSTVESLIK